MTEQGDITQDAGPQAGSRRLKTRQRISRAAQKLFLDRGIVGTSVDHIASAAGISRATFYLHFNSKEAILIDQLREQDGHLLRLYAMLRDADPADMASVRDWLVYYVTAVRAYRGHLYLFSLSTVFDSDARAFLVDQRRRVMALLGERYAAFRPEGDPQRSVRGLLMMFEVEQVITALVHGDIMPDDDTALDVLAERLHGFLASA